ncbi:hypothetical protein PYW07_012212 [Mythimna separata]|uniref:Uncharacterized protein n=1 Tax=Mythimna separata TaxID=271217 RepID=A0AAD7YMK1_MYTSE|nr:hypothetical protein PYW07_012212 [Mythimna separata]
MVPNEPTYMHEINKIIDECEDVNGRQRRPGDPFEFPLCEYSCVLKKIGFMDDNGLYTLYPGLAYIKNITANYAGHYEVLESIAKDCVSVNDEEVHDGNAGCERTFYIGYCFLKNQARLDDLA